MAEESGPEHGRPAAGGTPARRGPTVDMDPSGQVTGKDADRGPRQFLNYAFFKVDPALRRLDGGARKQATSDLCDIVEAWSARDEVIVRTYSLVGLRGDCDFMICSGAI